MLNKLSMFISGDESSFLEERVFNTAAFFLAAISLVVCGFLAGYIPLQASSASLFVLAVIFCLNFYFSRFRRNFLFSSTFFILGTLLFADLLWYLFPQYGISISYLYLFLLILMLMVKSVKWHLVFSSLFILNLLTLFFLASNLEDFDWLHAEPHVIYTLLIAILITAVVVSYFKKNYELERVLKEDSVRQLSNVNVGLENRNKHLIDFAHMVSHNLRSPMAGLKMLLNLHEMSKTEVEKADLMVHLKDGAYTLFNMVEDLALVMKDYTRLKDDQEELILHEVLEKAKHSLSGLILDRQARIESDFAVEVVHYPMVYLDSIFLNLLSNALKYAHPDRPVHIKLSSYMDQNAVMLKIEDNGLGIDMERYEQQLFKMYKTFHPEAQQDSKGVGLFLTKNQVELLGGKIWAESTAEEGTTFFIELYRV
jgi:signal transduction histidine kinase